MNDQVKAEFGEMFEGFVASDKVDAAGKRIGFIVKFRDNGTDFYAWVQKGKSTGLHNWEKFGALQRGKKFSSQKQATDWAYATAKERIANL